MRVGVVHVGPRAEPLQRHPEAGVDLGRSRGVEEDLVHPPVVRDRGQAALGDDQYDGLVGARRTD